MPRSASALVVALALVASLALPACSRSSGRAAPGPAGTAVVSHPIDGDTIAVEIAGTAEHVRLIGIDTPESVARDRPIECFGMEAKARMAELLPAGTVVRLVRDVEARDRYGRLLAYVYRAEDDLDVNLLMVEEGMAESFPFEPNTTRQAELDRAEADAKAAGRGLWPVCGSTDVAIAPPPG